MECLFGGEASEEDISNALDGSSGSTPTEQEIRDCFAPLYNAGGAAGSTTTTTPGSGSTDETEDAGEMKMKEKTAPVAQHQKMMTNLKSSQNTNTNT